MTATIRPAKPGDEADILRLITALADYEREPDAVEATAETLRAHLFAEVPRVFAHVAEQDGRIVGIAVWFLNFSTWTGRHGIYLEDLYVDPAARAAGWPAVWSLRWPSRPGPGATPAWTGPSSTGTSRPRPSTAGWAPATTSRGNRGGSTARRSPPWTAERSPEAASPPTGAAREHLAGPDSHPGEPPMPPAIDAIDPSDLPAPSAAFTHGTSVRGAERLVFVSGQPPWAVDAPVPEGFEAQCRLAWRNVERVLTSVGLSLGHLAKVTVYLSDRRDRDANSRIRAEVLGDHRPAITIIITGIYSEEWLLEIEGIAVA